MKLTRRQAHARRKELAERRRQMRFAVERINGMWRAMQASLWHGQAPVVPGALAVGNAQHTSTATPAVAVAERNNV